MRTAVGADASQMQPDGLKAGHLLALLGAVLVFIALWLPWFELQLGPLERSQLSDGARQVGGDQLAAFADGIASQIDGLRVDAWTAFGGEDVALALIAGFVAGVVLVAGGAGGAGIRVDRDAAAGVARLGGLVLAGIVVVRMVDRRSELLALAPGAWVALAGALAVLAGGVLAGAGRGAAPVTAASVAAAPPWPGDTSALAPVVAAHAATSVAPPPRRAP